LIDIVKELRPRYARVAEKMRNEDMEEALKCHPKYWAAKLEILNEKARLPTVATATRTMTKVEHKFLDSALRRVNEDVRDHEFHIHGESGIIGNKKGEITHFHHEPKGSVNVPLAPGDKYNLHTHPPFSEPETSAASRPDHISAALIYSLRNREILSYVTNGKDVLQIQPDSTELVKLLPNKKMEEKLGKFPVAFTIPKPAPRPYPFSNHQAPDPQ
jgi:hypothetical protein